VPNALPAIWDRLSDFDARYRELGSEAKSLLTGIKDEASFKAKIPDIDRRCPGFHESYRARL
jgi:cytochrome c556